MSKDAEHLIRVNDLIQRAGIDPLDYEDAAAVAFSALCWLRDLGVKRRAVLQMVEGVWRSDAAGKPGD